MITQILVTHESGCTVHIRNYWVGTNHREGVRVNVGDVLTLAEEGVTTEWCVKQVIGEYSDDVQVPPKSRVGTILLHIREGVPVVA